MLIERQVLAQIRDGGIDRVFRRWAVPRVKVGSQMRTAVGVLEVVALEEVDESALTDAEARAAGFVNASELLGWLAGREGMVFCIHLRHVGPDPRIELRDLIPNHAELGEIQERLRSLDRSSRHGPWTASTLAIIGRHPGTRAEDLAGMLGREKQPFKLDVRKLKEMGLTESLRIGYRLSPRGEAVLASIAAAG